MTPAEIEPSTFRFVAQHLNHCANAVPNNASTHRKCLCKICHLQFYYVLQKNFKFYFYQVILDFSYGLNKNFSSKIEEISLRVILSEERCEWSLWGETEYKIRSNTLSSTCLKVLELIKLRNIVCIFPKFCILKKTKQNKTTRVLQLYDAYSESKYCLVVKRNWVRFRTKFYCYQILHSSNYFSTYSPPLLRHLSQRGTSFCIPSS